MSKVLLKCSFSNLNVIFEKILGVGWLLGDPAVTMCRIPRQASLPNIQL